MESLLLKKNDDDEIVEDIRNAICHQTRRLLDITSKYING